MCSKLKPTDEEINAVLGNANFGNTPRRKVIDDALLQIAGGYATGHTAMCILQELGLIGKARGRYQNLTMKGKRYLYERYKPRPTEPAKLPKIEGLVQELIESKRYGDRYDVGRAVMQAARAYNDMMEE